MKLVVMLLLLLVSAASAQFEKEDAAMAACEKNCCLSNGGNWSNDTAYCQLSSYPKSYVSCEDACFSNATGSITSKAPRTDLCCAPAAMLGFICVGALIVKTRDPGRSRRRKRARPRGGSGE